MRRELRRRYLDVMAPRLPANDAVALQLLD
jgi:hypothetical protein